MFRSLVVATALLFASDAAAENWRVLDQNASYDVDSLRYSREMNAVTVIFAYRCNGDPANADCRAIAALIPPLRILFSCERDVMWEQRSSGEWSEPYATHQPTPSSVHRRDLAATLCAQKDSYQAFEGSLPNVRG